MGLRAQCSEARFRVRGSRVRVPNARGGWGRSGCGGGSAAGGGGCADHRATSSGAGHRDAMRRERGGDYMGVGRHLLVRGCRRGS